MISLEGIKALNHGTITNLGLVQAVHNVVFKNDLLFSQLGEGADNLEMQLCCLGI